MKKQNLPSYSIYLQRMINQIIRVNCIPSLKCCLNVLIAQSNILERCNTSAKKKKKNWNIFCSAEQMQQAVVWPNYSNHNNGNVAPPPLLLPPPPPSLQLLSDIGGARLVLTESKRKQQSTLPIVKIEADCGNSPTTIISKRSYYIN